MSRLQAEAQQQKAKAEQASRLQEANLRSQEETAQQQKAHMAQAAAGELEVTGGDRAASASGAGPHVFHGLV